MPYIRKVLAIAGTLLLLSTGILRAGAPDTLWTAMFGGAGQDGARSVCQDAGGFYSAAADPPCWFPEPN